MTCWRKTVTALDPQVRGREVLHPQDLLLRARVRDAPRAKDVGAVGELDGAGGGLLHEQDRDALLVELLEHVEDDVDHDRRQAKRGLVQEEQARPREERTRDRELLLLAAGK